MRLGSRAGGSYPRSTNRSVPPASQRLHVPATATAARATAGSSTVQWTAEITPKQAMEPSNPKARARSAGRPSGSTPAAGSGPRAPRSQEARPAGPTRPPTEQAAHRGVRGGVPRLVVRVDRGEAPEPGPRSSGSPGRSAGLGPGPPGHREVDPGAARRRAQLSMVSRARTPPRTRDPDVMVSRHARTGGRPTRPGRPTTTMPRRTEGQGPGPPIARRPGRLASASERAGRPGSPAPIARAGSSSPSRLPRGAINWRVIGRGPAAGRGPRARKAPGAAHQVPIRTSAGRATPRPCQDSDRRGFGRRTSPPGREGVGHGWGPAGPPGLDEPVQPVGKARHLHHDERPR